MPSSTLQLLVSLPPVNPAANLEDPPSTRSPFSVLLHPTAKRPSPLSYTARFLNQRSRLAIRAEAKLRSSEVSKGNALPDAKRRKKIVLFEAAPAILEESRGRGDIVGSGTAPDENRKNGGFDLLFLLKKLPKRVLAALSNLPLAIGEMFTIATLMALATVIDQGEAPDFYFQMFPEENPLFGFVTWRWVLGLGFDHMFTSPIFLGMLVLLAASLMSCTYTTQIPMVKVARRWSFIHSAEAIHKLEFSDSLPHASIQDVGVILMGAGYEVSQFHSDISLFDVNGKELTRKTISVNDPLRYGGITIYQTDWGFSAIQVSKDDQGPFNLAMAPLQRNGDKKLYGTFLPVGDTNSSSFKGISMLARDLQSIALYDQEGKFVGVRRPSSKLPIDIDGMKIVIEDAIGSTGLDLKTDPGVPTVYAGFGALMLTTCISYLSHSQIWALQDGTTVVVGGKTNRAKLEFPDEMNSLLDKVPELVDADEKKNN